MGKPVSKRWNETNKVLLEVEPSDIFFHCVTDDKGKPLFHSRRLQGIDITAIIGSIEKKCPLPLKGMEVWTVRANAIGQISSLSVENKNKSITLVIPADSIN